MNEHFEIFLEKYNKESELIKKLGLMYDFVDDILYKDEIDFQFFLNSLLLLINHFNNINFHLSEIKTVLVISKTFKDNEVINEARKKLVETYNKKK